MMEPVKVVLTFESADENLRGDDPNETSPVAFSFYFFVFQHFKKWDLEIA